MNRTVHDICDRCFTERHPLFELRDIDDGGTFIEEFGMNGSLIRGCYQIRQWLTGAMGWPALQPNALANSGMLTSAPFTRTVSGEWVSV